MAARAAKAGLNNLLFARHSCASRNPVSLHQTAWRRWIPAFAGMTSKIGCLKEKNSRPGAEPGRLFRDLLLAGDFLGGLLRRLGRRLLAGSGPLDRLGGLLHGSLLGCLLGSGFLRRLLAADLLCGFLGDFLRLAGNLLRGLLHDFLRGLLDGLLRRLLGGGLLHGLLRRLLGGSLLHDLLRRGLLLGRSLLRCRLLGGGLLGRG